MSVCAGRPPTGYSRRGGGAKPQGSEGGGRSGLLALLRAVEETDQDCSDPAGEDLMDWAAAAADVGGADDDQPDRSYGGRGRRTARGKRPRYGPEHSSIHSDSGYSYDSTGQDSRRWDAAGAAAAGAHSDGVGWSDREQEQGEGAWEGSRRQRQRTGYTHGRIRRTNDDNYIYGDDLDSVADAALLAAAAAAGGQRGSGKPGPKAAAAAAARAPSPAAAVQQQGPKRHRCVAGNNQWLTEDGLTVWPKVGRGNNREGTAGLRTESIVSNASGLAAPQGLQLQLPPQLAFAPFFLIRATFMSRHSGWPS